MFRIQFIDKNISVRVGMCIKLKVRPMTWQKNVSGVREVVIVKIEGWKM